MEYTGYLKTNIRFLQVPVELKEKNGNTITIGREQLAHDTDSRAGTVFVAPLKFQDSEGYVRLGTKKNGTNIYALESADGGVSIFQDGIFVFFSSCFLVVISRFLQHSTAETCTFRKLIFAHQ